MEPTHQLRYFNIHYRKYYKGWIQGVRNIADDILVFGSTYEEHIAVLEECLKRLRDNGLTLNLGKCLFLKQNLEFLGIFMVLKKDGVSPHPKEISALSNSATPTTSSEVRSLLGMANFSAQFIQNFATLTDHFVPLHTKMCL